MTKFVVTTKVELCPELRFFSGMETLDIIFSGFICHDYRCNSVNSL